jgi:hypothetical protein
MAHLYDARGSAHLPLEESGTLDYAPQHFQSVDDPTFDAIFDDPWLSLGLGMFDATTANYSLQPYLDPHSAAILDTAILDTAILDTAIPDTAIPDTAILDMIQTQFLDTAAAQPLDHRGFLGSMSSKAILPLTDLSITPLDSDHNFWDIMSMPLSSETNTASTTSCTTPGAPDSPEHRLPPPSSISTPLEKPHKCPIDGCGSAFTKAGRLK